MPRNFKHEDTGRFGFVRRQEISHRKFAVVLNGNIRSRLDTYDNSLAREKYEASSKLTKSSMEWKRNLVEQKVLQKCLKMRQDAEDMGTQHLYGRYGGVPLEAIAKDVPRQLAKLDPKWKRLKEVEKLKKDGFLKGAILRDCSVSKRMSDFFSTIATSDIPDNVDVRNQLHKVNRNDVGRRRLVSETRLRPIRAARKSATTVKSFPGTTFARDLTTISAELSRQSSLIEFVEAENS